MQRSSSSTVDLTDLPPACDLSQHNESPAVKQITDLPEDICILMATKFLKKPEIYSLLQTSNALFGMFSDARIKRSFLVIERNKLIAYAKVFLNPLSVDGVDNRTHSRQTRVKESFGMLHQCLRYGDDAAFFDMTKLLLAKVNPQHLVEQRNELLDLYNKLFFADDSSKTLLSLIENCEKGRIRSHLSMTRKMFILVRSLVRCDSVLLLTKLLDDMSKNVLFKRRFLHYFGGDFLCDAIIHFKPAIVKLLLRHGVSPNLSANRDEFIGVMSLIPLECALQLLTVLYRELTDSTPLVDYSESISMIEHMITILLKAGADPDLVSTIQPLPTSLQPASRLPRPIIQRPTIREFAAGMVADVAADSKFDQEEKESLLGAFCLIVDHFKPEPMEIDEDDSVDGQDIAKLTSHDVEPSPKKAKSTPSSPEKDPESPTRATGLAGLEIRHRKLF